MTRAAPIQRTLGRGAPRVAIIGGGPGGAHCARRLAEAGLEATLFEARTSFEKPCGGGIPARGLDRYDFLDHPGLPVKRLEHCVVIAPSGREAGFPLHEPLYVFSRADLHTFLLRRAVEAGARLVRARVVSFERGAGAPGAGGRGAWLLRALPGDAGVETAPVVHGPFDFLVAADGAAGTARRRLAGPPRSRHLSQGIGYYIPDLSEGHITLKFYEGLHGYLWVFPRPDHSSAGICATLGSLPARELKDLMDRFLHDRYGAESLARSGRYAALIPAPAQRDDPPHQGEGWALVGDSGGFVDPLTREGIYYAMLSGDLLAGCLALGRPEAYAEAWREGCGRELAWASTHAGRFFEARFVERLVTLCSGSPTVGRILSDLIGGRQPYVSLKLRLVLSLPRIAVDLAAGGLSGRRPPRARPAGPALRPAGDS